MSDLDGIEKNLDKLKKEYAKLRDGMKPHWQRFKSEKDTHSYVNLFVEAMRLSPYLIGHIDAIAWPVMLALLIWAIIK